MQSTPAATSKSQDWSGFYGSADMGIWPNMHHVRLLQNVWPALHTHHPDLRLIQNFWEEVTQGPTPSESNFETRRAVVNFKTLLKQRGLKEDQINSVIRLAYENMDRLLLLPIHESSRTTSREILFQVLKEARLIQSDSVADYDAHVKSLDASRETKSQSAPPVAATATSIRATGEATASNPEARAPA
jgi:hypothetical protein